VRNSAAAPNKRLEALPRGIARETKEDWTRLCRPGRRNQAMLVMFILPVIVLIAIVGSLPIWRHSKKWGFYPISGISLIILILLFLFWSGRL
jgi:hypothetical protein